MRKSLGDIDEEDEAMFAEEEEQEHSCVVELAEVFGILCHSQKQTFLPLFQEYVPFVMELVVRFLNDVKHNLNCLHGLLLLLFFFFVKANTKESW